MYWHCVECFGRQPCCMWQWNGKKRCRGTACHRKTVCVSVSVRMSAYGLFFIMYVCRLLDDSVLAPMSKILCKILYEPIRELTKNSIPIKFYLFCICCEEPIHKAYMLDTYAVFVIVSCECVYSTAINSSNCATHNSLVSVKCFIRFTFVELLS